MLSATLLPGLVAFACAACGGTWIPSGSYQSWRERHPADLPEHEDPGPELAVTDSTTPKLCPECGHLLLPYRVGHGISFVLDHCGGCNGVWCDRNEWETVKRHDLHANLPSRL